MPGNSDHNRSDLLDMRSTDLALAVQEGSLEAVESLVKEGCDVNEADFLGLTALHYTAEFGHESITRCLIAAGADVDCTRQAHKYGLSALHTAACKGQAGVAAILIESGCDLNAVDNNGISVLHCAVSNGHDEVAMMLLEAKAKLNIQGKTTQRSPLFLACETDNHKVAEALLKRGARVNLQDAYGMTSLCAVCLYNNTRLAELLVEYGAKVTLGDNRENTPLHYAARHGNTKLTQLLLRRRSGVNEVNKHGETPLHLAVRTCHTPTAAMLLEHGADANSYSRHVGDTPLQLAVRCYTDANEFEHLLVTSLEYGANLNHGAYDYHMSPLYLAIHLGKSAHSVLLIQHGASPNVDCPFNMTVLHKACQKGDSASATLLLLTPIQWHRETWLQQDIHTSGINPKLLCGYAKHIPMVLLDHLDIFSLIQHVLSHPYTLMHLCRQVVRESLGRAIHKQLLELGLPKRLHDYVMLKIL